MARFLLLHGACHGGWCWDAVAQELDRRGHVAIAPDLPCDDLSAGLEEYTAVAATAAGADETDLVVVGHSLGALTAAAVASRVATRRLVFVAGIIGAPAMSLEGLAAIDTDRDVALQDGDYETDGHGRFRFTEGGGARALYQDCDPEVAAAAAAQLRFQRSLWTEVAPFAAWPTVEIHSIVCGDDRVVHPAWSRRVTKERLGVDPIELAGGHSPMLSRPGALTEVLVSGLD